MYHTEDTIVAVASASGGAARGIVRLGGPEVLAVLERCFRPSSGPSLSAVSGAQRIVGTVKLSAAHLSQVPADVYLWPTARSYTRQPLAEIHLAGSPPLLAAVLQMLCAQGARMAERGEFTMRAFLAGRLDLPQAEAVLGVIDARSEQQLQSALQQLAGGLSQPLDHLRDQLLELAAHLEAGLDFVEEDIQFITAAEAASQLDAAVQLLDATVAQLTSRSRHDALPRVVLIGLPNVGKSSLFNALAGETALVSNEPGTTRDYLTARLELDGVAVQLVDTAGRAAPGENPIERDSQQQAGEQADQADLRLLCLDVSRPLEAWEHAQLQTPAGSPPHVVWTKCDQARVAPHLGGGLETSARSGRGIDHLRAWLAQQARELAEADSAGNSTAERCGESLRLARERLDEARELNRTQRGEELIAAEVRLALTEIGKVVGTIYTDDILDRVFSRFCIGK